MAVLATLALLPDEDGFASLSRLNGSVRIHYKKVLTSAPARVVLASEANDLVLLRVDFRDVVFKFECFAIMPELVSSLPWAEVSELGRIDGWHAIKCLFRFEWSRPASFGEIPSNFEQIKRNRGVQSAVERNLTAIGVSMVGIMFWNVEDASPVALIFSHDDDSAALRLTSAREEINDFVRECECVHLVDAVQWVSDCRRWLESIKAQAS
jgi:hypothetical protein